MQVCSLRFIGAKECERWAGGKERRDQARDVGEGDQRSGYKKVSSSRAVTSRHVGPVTQTGGRQEAAEIAA